MSGSGFTSAEALDAIRIRSGLELADFDAAHALELLRSGMSVLQIVERLRESKC